jgi:putative iron-regulated protein
MTPALAATPGDVTRQDADIALARDQDGRTTAPGAALILAAVDALVTQTAAIDRAVTALGPSRLTIAGPDSPDIPNAVFQ